MADDFIMTIPDEGEVWDGQIVYYRLGGEHGL